MKLPSPATLKKYGLSLSEWQALYNKYDGCCHICKKPFKKLIFVDHEHVKGWKKLPPEERRKFVRGLLCYVHNNKLMQKGNDDIETLKSAVRYLEDYEARKTTNILPH